MAKIQAGNPWLMWMAVALVTGLGSFYGLSLAASFSIDGYRSQAIGRARQVIGHMNAYAADHAGHYPDHGLDVTKATSNEAFRRLILEGLTRDETIFHVFASRYVPDNNIGTAPAFENALIERENPWALVAGLTPKSPVHYPLMFENATDASWPPVWRARPRGGPVKGRTWRDGTVLVGFNDTSIQIVELTEKNVGMHLPATILRPEGKKPVPTLRVLDILP